MTTVAIRLNVMLRNSFINMNITLFVGTVFAISVLVLALAVLIRAWPTMVIIIFV
jgi:hypothetical protein